MLTAGTSLGPYKILAPLGAGGMGEVYRAHDPRLGRDVAIKVLPSHLAATREARARFEREARTISQLNHPHICTLHDIGHQDDTDYLVMELLEGETLAHRLERGPLPVAEVLSLGIQIADALGRAHRAGIVHRDLKPGNVMLTKTGAKLMDFGLARPPRQTGPATAGPEPAPEDETLGQSPTMSRPLTAVGTIVGTVPYMAPEQLEGREADARTDLWALGCVLYEMTTGKRAFEGASQASLIAAIMEREPPAITLLQPLTPPALERIVRRCLAKDPDARFQSASDLAFDLDTLSGLWPLAPAPAPAGATASRKASRLAWILAGAAALVGLAFVASHMLWTPAPPAQPTYQRLTFRRGTIGRARFAPEGRTVVYDARWDGKPSEIFTLRPGNPESRPLGITEAKLLGVSSRGELAIQLQPALWMSFSKGTLARVPLEGGAPRAVREEVFDADWMPDGSRLVVAPSDSDFYYIRMPAGTTIARSPSPLLPMRTSPDGRAVTCWRTSAALDGGELVLAGAGTPDRVLCRIDFACTGLVWNPRTGELWYSEKDSVGSTCLRAVATSGRCRTLLRVAGHAVLHDIAADGSVLLSMESSRMVMHVLALGWTEERDLSWLDGSWPCALSPDGRTLLVEESGAAVGRVPLVYLRSTDGSPAVRLGEGRPQALSPDGRWVVAWLGGERPWLRLIPVGAGEARDVATGEVVPTGGVWYFPDGRRLLFRGRLGSPARQMFAVPVEGGTPSPVTSPGWSCWAGEQVLSPDGRWLAVIDQDRVNHVVSAEGGSPRAVPGLARGEVVLGWTSDSSGLYVFARGEVPARIYRVDVATGQRQLWKELGPADRAGVSLINYAVIARDGRSYAYAFDRSQTDLYLVKGLK
jgi:eukaryotic-like serine/threonine-protein kinase